MSNAVTLEEIEQRFIDEANHACSQKSYSLLIAELSIAETLFGEDPTYDNSRALAVMRERVARAHRAIFRVVE